jgi:hypothetical protein
VPTPPGLHAFGQRLLGSGRHEEEPHALVAAAGEHEKRRDRSRVVVRAGAHRRAGDIRHRGDRAERAQGSQPPAPEGYQQRTEHDAPHHRRPALHVWQDLGKTLEHPEDEPVVVDDAAVSRVVMGD